MEYLKGFGDYILYRKNFSLNTLDGYTRDVRQFILQSGKEVTDVRESDLEDFITGLGREGLSIATRNRKLSSLKKFFKYLYDRGVVEYNPALSLEGGKRDIRLPSPADIEDIFLLKDTADNLRDKVMIELLYATGVRRVELIGIKRRHINFTRGSINIIGKGNKERLVPLYSGILVEVNKLFDFHGSEWLFPSPVTKDSPLSTRRVNEIIEKWVIKAGLTDKGITPHSFRHSFCSHLYANGADIKTIRDLAGHESTSTTDIYTKVDSTRNLEEYNKFHPWAE